jgi:hypothetical protein
MGRRRRESRRPPAKGRPSETKPCGGSPPSSSLSSSSHSAWPWYRPVGSRDRKRRSASPVELRSVGRSHETTQRSATAPSGHAPLVRAPNAPTDLVSALFGTQEPLPRRPADTRTILDPARPTSRSLVGVVPTREADHRGSEKRGFWVRTGRRRGRGTGPPDRSPVPRHPPGDTGAHDGFGRRTNSLAT